MGKNMDAILKGLGDIVNGDDEDLEVEIKIRDDKIRKLKEELKKATDEVEKLKEKSAAVGNEMKGVQTTVDKFADSLTATANALEKISGAVSKIKLDPKATGATDFSKSIDNIVEKLHQFDFKYTNQQKGTTTVSAGLGPMTVALKQLVSITSELKKGLLGVEKEIENTDKKATKASNRLKLAAGDKDLLKNSPLFNPTTKAEDAKPKEQATNIAGMAEAVNLLKQALAKVNPVLDQFSKRLTIIGKNKGVFTVKINNEGFQKVLDTMYNAIQAFEKREARGGKRKRNFFETAFGTKEDNKKSVETVKATIGEAAKEAIESIANSLSSESLGKTIGDALAEAVSDGIKRGAEQGINNISTSSTAEYTSFIANLINGAKLKPKDAADYLKSLSRTAAGIDPTPIEQARIAAEKEIRLAEIAKDQAVETAERVAKQQGQAQAKIEKLNLENGKKWDQQVETLRAILDRVDPKTGKAYGDTIGGKMLKQQETLTKKYQLQYEMLLKKQREGKHNREQYQRDVIRFQKELEEYQGKELTKYDKTKIQLKGLIEKYKELEVKALRGNKYDQATLFNNMRRIQEVTRQRVMDEYEEQRNLEEIIKKAQRYHKVLTALASGFQRLSAGIGSVGQIFSTLRAQAQSLFGYMTNSIRRLSGYIRSTLNTALSDGVEQYTQLESAKIAFESFFGADRADNVLEAVRKEALKTPIVTAGDLSEYVMQLAPVSNGNASLAINAALGALKTVAYSGSDTSEMEYVIKNIRDVIAKGTATAIDIRQFNRAMPGLENAIRQMGYDEFLNSEGQLSVTKQNVGQILDMFAKLNTDENSPLAKINERQLKTLEGMKNLLKERRTTLVENVLNRGGVFDLVKDALGLGKDENVWDNLEKFFVKHVYKVVQFIRKIDWERIGKNLQDGFGRISSALSTAWEQIKGALGNMINVTTMEDAFNLLWTIVEKFIEGFKNGAQVLINTINTVTKLLGEDGFAKLAEAVGFLVSPAGKIISTLLSLTRDLTAGISRAFATLDSITKSSYGKKIAKVQEAAGQYANLVISKDIDDAIRLQSQEGVATELYGKIAVNGDRLYTKNSKGESVISYMNKSWDELSSYQKRQAVGTWNYIKTTAVNTLNHIKTAAFQLVKGVGAAFAASQFIDMVSNAAKEAKIFGDSTEKIVNVMNILAKTITGAVIGALIGGGTGAFVGAIGMAVVALYNWADALNKSIAEEKERELVQLKSEAHQKQYDAILKYLEGTGVNTDTGSEEGFYASEKLKQYLNKFDDPEGVNYNKAAMVFSEALRFAQTQEAMIAYTKTDEFHDAYKEGKLLDWDVDTAYRDKLADLVTYFRLNGDYYDYDANSKEAIVKQYTGGDSFTAKQVDLLVQKWGDLDKSLGENTTELLNGLDANESAFVKEVKEAIKPLRESIETTNDELLNANHWMMKLLYGDKYTALNGYVYGYNGKDYTPEDLYNIAASRIKTMREGGMNGTELAEEAILDEIINNMTLELGSENFDLSKYFNQLLSSEYGDIYADLMSNRGKADVFEGGIFGVSELLDNTINSAQKYFEDIKGRSLSDSQASLEMVKGKSSEEISAYMDTFWDQLDKNTREQLDAYYQSVLEEEGKSKPLFSKTTEHAFADVKDNAEWAGALIPGGLGFTLWKKLFGAPNILGNLFSAKGGFVPSYRSAGGVERGVDTVPAMLQPGEFVVRKSSVNNAGLSALTALNRGDIATAARSLGSRINSHSDYSRSWSNVVNNNQRTSTANVRIYNRNASSRMTTYSNLANRIALA